MTFLKSLLNTKTSIDEFGCSLWWRRSWMACKNSNMNMFYNIINWKHAICEHSSQLQARYLWTMESWVWIPLSPDAFCYFSIFFPLLFCPVAPWASSIGPFFFSLHTYTLAQHPLPYLFSFSFYFILIMFINFHSWFY